MEFNLLGDAVEVAEAAHEGVTKVAEVGAIFHLLGEDVAGFALARDMEDIDGAVLNPFAGAVFMESKMGDVFHGGRVSPDDDGGVVIVDEGRF